jgi:5-methylcytosine-specific restriction protein A
MRSPEYERAPRYSSLVRVRTEPSLLSAGELELECADFARPILRVAGGWLMHKLCLEPGCGNAATSRGRCDEHRRAKERDRSRARRKQARERNRMYAREKWAIVRRRKLFEVGLCELQHPGCLGIASEVHHKVAMEDGGAADDMENLVSACKPCHSVETRREQLQRDPVTA